MNANPFQFNAMQNGSPSLTQQLYAGGSPNALAGAGNVKSPYAPGASALGQGISLGVTTPTSAPTTNLGITSPGTQGAPQFSMTTGNPPPALGSLGTTPVVKHTIAANGDQSVTHAQPSTSSTPTAPTPPATTASTNKPAPTPPPQPQNGNPYIAPLAGNSVIGSPVAGSAASGLLSAPSQNAAIGQQAVDIANQFGQRYADVGQQGAKFRAGQLTTGTSPVAEGNAAVTAQTTAAEQAALAQGEQAALQGTAQELTAQNQGQQGLTSAGGLGIQGQNLLQSGLTSAAGLAQPKDNYPFVFNPNTGTFTNAATGGIATAQDLAGEVLSGKIPYSQAVSALGYMGGTGEAQLQSAIMAQNPNANLTQLQAQVAGSATGTQNVAAAGGTAAAQNIVTGGTANTNAANTGYQQAVNDYGDMTGKSNAANSQIQTVQSVLTQSGLNQGIPDYNKAINTLQTKLGGTAYTQLVTAMTEAQNMYSQLLSAGGTTPSGSEAQALALLNPNSSASQINAAFGQLQTAAYNKLNAQYGKMQTFKSNLGGGGSANSNTGTGAFSDSTFYPNK